MENKAGISELFGSNVFNESAMREYLPQQVYDALQQIINEHGSLTPEIAEAVAEGMKNWALSKGATHYTHWFQPMTNATAEKHDSFIGKVREGRALLEFSGKELMKGEPDASSFPSGGLRATFEARGYTAWDCTSPAYIRETAAGATLCIPTAFCSFTGEALDKKTPLLRSMQALDRECVRLLRALGNTEVRKVIPCVGAEQEYFLVDRELFLKREDMVFAGRTLFGAPAPKAQELDDHYYGSIRERIAAFMKDLNTELWKMGVPAKTQHNEAAPAQHELASVYAQANIATDQNQIVMDTLKRTAYRHGLHCLLHEKPFAGVNGSGKHNNWSLSTDTGANLLEPGRTPHENLQFLLLFVCVLRAVDLHADALRASATCPGNDARLGMQEAPPAVISAHIGDQMEDVLRQFIESGGATHSLRGHHLRTGVESLPAFVKDATDRNRTSPFAFTGNKFEFRMVGSSDSVAGANTVLNTIVAESFADAADVLEKAGSVHDAVVELIARWAGEHRRIIFNGDGYADEWVKEAERRGLPNLPTMADAAPALLFPHNLETFERFRVFTRSELEARVGIKLDTYVKAMNIEARTMLEMAERQILPAGILFMKEVAEAVRAAREVDTALDTAPEEAVLRDVTESLGALRREILKLRRRMEELEKERDIRAKSRFVKEKIVPAMQALRRPADRLETLVRDGLWPFPTYAQLMFEI